MRGDRVGQLGRIVDLVDRDQHLGRDLLVELDVLLELGDHRARQGFQLARLAVFLAQHVGRRLEEGRVLGEAGDLGAGAAFDQHLDRAVGQLQQLENGGQGADAIDVVGGGIVLGRVLLRHQQDLLVVLHHIFEGANGFFATDEKRDDHVGENDDVAERQNREDFVDSLIRHVASFT